MSLALIGHRLLIYSLLNNDEGMHVYIHSTLVATVRRLAGFNGFKPPYTRFHDVVQHFRAMFVKMLAATTMGI